VISWNIATKEISLGITLQNRVRRVIAKLEKHLKSFPPDAVHLQIMIEKHKGKGLFTTALTLYLPPGVLRTEKTSKDALESVNGAVHALLRELEKLKSKLRREPLWKRVARRAELHDSKARFAASPSPQPVTDEAESVRTLLERFHPRLLSYIKRHIHRAELEDEVVRGALDPDAVLISVAEKALKLTLKNARAGER
jgi:ribosomal subunit interface protein